MMDTNKNGDLSLGEFESGCSTLRYPMAGNSYNCRLRRKNLFRVLDIDNSGGLDHYEFTRGVHQDI